MLNKYHLMLSIKWKRRFTLFPFNYNHRKKKTFVLDKNTFILHTTELDF